MLSGDLLLGLNFVCILFGALLKLKQGGCGSDKKTDYHNFGDSVGYANGYGFCKYRRANDRNSDSTGFIISG